MSAFVQVLRLLRDPHLLADPAGMIVATNVACAEALGTSVAALEGAALADFAPASDELLERLRAGASFPLSARDGRRYVCDPSLLAPDLFLLRLSGGSEAEPRSRGLVASLSRLPDAILDDRAASQLAVLYAFTEALAKAITPDEVTEVVVDVGMAATSARAGGLWLLSADGTSVSLTRSVGPTGPRSEAFASIPLEPASRMPILDAISRGTSVWIESCRQLEDQYPEAFRAFSRGGESSLACIPMFAQGRCIGGLALNYATARPFHEDERAFLRLIGWHAAQALERARLYTAERVARREAEMADRLKDEFLAILSHELRNPLAPILSALELMSLRDREAFTVEREIISRNIEHVLRLVGDLLDVARITHGKITLQTTRCELSRIIVKAVEMTTSVISGRNHQLTVTAPNDIVVIGDETRLAQTIANLLTNAAKYTEPHGTISVTVVVEDATAVIRVSDSGIGIPEQVLPRIFEPFVQEQRTLDRAYGGLGIGLTVVQRIVSLHHGTVAARSAGRGRGTEIEIRLPLAPDVATAVVTEPPPTPLETAKQLRVLVVDDNRDAAETLHTILEFLGCVSHVSYDGATALAAIAEFEPDVALLDIGLPVMDGYELARRLRVLVAGSTRIVAVTGYGQESDLARAREAGFDEHVLKPVTLDTLREILQRASNSGRDRRSPLTGVD